MNDLEKKDVGTGRSKSLNGLQFSDAIVFVRFVASKHQVLQDQSILENRSIFPEHQ